MLDNRIHNGLGIGAVKALGVRKEKRHDFKAFAFGSEVDGLQVIDRFDVGEFLDIGKLEERLQGLHMLAFGDNMKRSDVVAKSDLLVSE